MALIDNETLTGRMLELETSHWPKERFFSMCDSLLSTMTGYDIKSTPQITSRVHTSDRELDASVEIPDDQDMRWNRILKNGLNVFQYKLISVLAQDRYICINGLKNQLKGEFKRVSIYLGKEPRKYVLVTNVDLTGVALNSLKKRIIDGLDKMYEGRVEIIEAGMLAIWLNCNPQLQAEFIGPIQNLQKPKWELHFWDYDMDQDSIKHHLRDKTSPHRKWLIARILRDQKWQDIQDILSLEQIEEVIDDVSMAEQKREAIKKSIKIWRNEI